MNVLANSLMMKSLLLLGFIVALVVVALLVVKLGRRKADDSYASGGAAVGVVNRIAPPETDEQWDANPATARFGEVAATPTPTIPGLGIAPELIRDKGLAAKEMFAGLPNEGSVFETIDATSTRFDQAVTGVYEVPDDMVLPGLPTEASPSSVETPQGFQHVGNAAGETQEVDEEWENTLPDVTLPSNPDTDIVAHAAPAVPEEMFMKVVEVEDGHTPAAAAPPGVTPYAANDNPDENLPPMPPIFRQ